jgi:endonuclease G
MDLINTFKSTKHAFLVFLAVPVLLLGMILLEISDYHKLGGFFVLSSATLVLMHAYFNLTNLFAGVSDKIFKAILLIGILLLTILTSSLANAKNCTKTQKLTANQILLNLQQNTEKQESLLEYHMPFGVHESELELSNESLFYQNGFLAMHDSDLKTSLWTSYRLTKSDLLGMKGKKRINCFRTDPRLDKSDTGISSDYNEAIYDQGHLTSDSDVKDELYDQLNSYTFVNMSPQHCFFNRGIWLNLEHLTRKLAYKNSEIFVTSGAIFDRDNADGRDIDSEAERMESRNGKSRVAIPSHFYKVILKRSGEHWSSLAFLLPHNNQDHGTSWKKAMPYAIKNIVSIEEIEAKATINLFPNLQRNAINQNNGNDWDISKAGNGMTGRCKHITPETID